MTWTPEQVANAKVIVSTGQKLGASSRDVMVALMAAMQESGLRNLNYGDRDSLGLFQQRAAWGSAQARTDPAEAARMFFQGGQGGQRGLLSVSNRNQLAPTQAAQAVQGSAFPDAYAKWQSDAQGLLKGFGVTGKIPGTLAEVPSLYASPTDGPSATDVSKALGVPDAGAQLDAATTAPTTYQGGNALAFDNADGGTLDFQGSSDQSDTDSALGGLTFGMAPFADESESNPLQAAKIPTLDEMGYNPTTGSFSTDDPSTKYDVSGLLDQVQGNLGGKSNTAFGKSVTNIAKKYLGIPYVWGGTSPSGFDCSGLVQYVYKQLGVDLPRLSADQARQGQRIPLDQAQAGDLIAYDNSSRNVGADHIAIAIGNGMMIEAPHTGADVRVSKIYGGNAWAVRLPQVASYDQAEAQHVQQQAQAQTKQQVTQHAAQNKVTDAQAAAKHSQMGR